jgi:hypothetical protein
MPEHSADHRVWTVRLRPGIFFATTRPSRVHPARAGRAGLRLHPQALCRPGQQVKSPAVDRGVPTILGLNELRDKALKRQAALRLRHPDRRPARAGPPHAADHARPPRPRFAESLANSSTYGAVAREVVEALRRQDHGAPGGHRPVPAGVVAAFVADRAGAQPRLPRAVRYDATPGRRRCRRPGLRGAAAGPRLPLVDRVEVSIIEEAQPRWLSFLATVQIDLLEDVPQEFIAQALPGGQAGAHLARRASRAGAGAPATEFTFFNMEHPVVGGYDAGQGGAAPRHRRWRYDMQREIDQVYRGQAIPRSRHQPAGLRLRPGLPQRRRRPTTCRAPRRCSTCTATPTATATAGASSPTASRWCWNARPSRKA